MDRRIRDKLQIAGASDEYIMSRKVEVSIRKPTDEERRKGQLRRRFFAGPHDYIQESLEHLRAVARRLEIEEPSLLSIEQSIDMVILHWLAHDDVRVWRAPAEDAAVGLMTTFFPEIRRVELVHLYDEDTAGKFSYRCELAASPLPAAMRDSFAAEWQQIWEIDDQTEPIGGSARRDDGLAGRLRARPGSAVAKTLLRKLIVEEAAARTAR